MKKKLLHTLACALMLSTLSYAEGTCEPLAWHPHSASVASCTPVTVPLNFEVPSPPITIHLADAVITNDTSGDLIVKVLLDPNLNTFPGTVTVDISADFSPACSGTLATQTFTSPNIPASPQIASALVLACSACPETPSGTVTVTVASSETGISSTITQPYTFCCPTCDCVTCAAECPPTCQMCKTLVQNHTCTCVELGCMPKSILDCDRCRTECHLCSCDNSSSSSKKNSSSSWFKDDVK